MRILTPATAASRHIVVVIVLKRGERIVQIEVFFVEVERFFIVGGRGTVLLEGSERPIKGGDVIYIPADELHQFKAAAAEQLKFLCIIPMSRNCGDPTPGS